MIFVTDHRLQMVPKKKSNVPWDTPGQLHDITNFFDQKKQGHQESNIQIQNVWCPPYTTEEFQKCID